MLGAPVRQLGLHCCATLVIQVYPSWHINIKGVSKVLDSALVPVRYSVKVERSTNVKLAD